jgi:lysophospholipase L1-like esterase
MKTYLALGDSYTIGELVETIDNFPNQIIHLLKDKNIEVELKDNIAKTGWTTDELLLAIDEKKIDYTVDYVTLLIGVNNQYRGYSIEQFKKEFEQLLQKAISFAGNNSRQVIVFSIPDWGLTPFNITRDKKTISTEIDIYNACKKEICLQYNCHFLDITESTRTNAQDKKYLAEDGLHPSKYEYEIWAKQLADLMI